MNNMNRGNLSQRTNKVFLEKIDNFVKSLPETESLNLRWGLIVLKSKLKNNEGDVKRLHKVYMAKKKKLSKLKNWAHIIAS